jgi:hypothetical protein
VSVIDSTYYINKDILCQEIMMSTISVETFFTVLPNTNLTYSHPIFLHSQNGIHALNQKPVLSSVVYHVHVLLYNAAEYIFTC